MNTRHLALGLLTALVLSSAAPAQADLMVGPSPLGPYAIPTDLAIGNVLVIYDPFPMPSSGWIDYFQSVVLPGSNDAAAGAGNFRALLLRPAGPSVYDVIAAQDFVAPIVATPTLWDYDLLSPWAVQAGDVYAHFGNGIPLNIPTTNPAEGLLTIYPSSLLPVVGATIVVPSATYPIYPSPDNPQLRDYSLAAHVVPEPASLLLLGSGLVGLARLRKRPQ